MLWPSLSPGPSVWSVRGAAALSCALRQTHCFLSLTHANKYSRDSRLSHAFFRPGLFLNLCTLMVYYYHHYYYYICMLVILLCCGGLTSVATIRMGPLPWVDLSSRTEWAAWTWSVAALRPTAERCRPGWASWWRCNRDPGTCWSGSGRRSSPPPHRQKPWPSRAERPIRIREALLTPWATPSSRAWSPWYWAAAPL